MPGLLSKLLVSLMFAILSLFFSGQMAYSQSSVEYNVLRNMPVSVLAPVIQQTWSPYGTGFVGSNWPQVTGTAWPFSAEEQRALVSDMQCAIGCQGRGGGTVSDAQCDAMVAYIMMAIENTFSLQMPNGDFYQYVTLNPDGSIVGSGTGNTGYFQDYRFFLMETEHALLLMQNNAHYYGMYKNKIISFLPHIQKCLDAYYNNGWYVGQSNDQYTPNRCMADAAAAALGHALLSNYLNVYNWDQTGYYAGNYMTEAHLWMNNFLAASPSWKFNNQRPLIDPVTGITYEGGGNGFGYDVSYGGTALNYLLYYVYNLPNDSYPVDPYQAIYGLGNFLAGRVHATDPRGLVSGVVIDATDSTRCGPVAGAYCDKLGVDLGGLNLPYWDGLVNYHYGTSQTTGIDATQLLLNNPSYQVVATPSVAAEIFQPLSQTLTVYTGKPMETVNFYAANTGLMDVVSSPLDPAFKITATGLPSGLVMGAPSSYFQSGTDNDGFSGYIDQSVAWVPISGTTTANPGTYTVTLTPWSSIVNYVPNLSGNYVPSYTITGTQSGTPVTVTINVLSGTPPVPTITSTLSMNGMTNVPFNYQITDSGTTNTLTTFAASGLPAGLSVNTATGIISGTPTASGTFSSSISAINAGGTGSATLTVVVATNPEVYAINSGAGGAVYPFSADNYYSGGSTMSTNSYMDFTGLVNPAPLAVYKTQRYGNLTYTFPNLTVGGNYLVRLHFAELFYGGTGSRIFNVSISGTQVLTNFDIFAAAGKNVPIIKQFNAQANGSGQMVIQFTNVVNNAAINGIEIINLQKPVITSGTVAVVPNNGTVNYQPSYLNNPTSFSQSGLPSGLSLNTTTGKITGTATTSGTYSVTLSSINASGTTSTVLSLLVTPPPPVVTSALTITATCNLPFSYQITGSSSVSGTLSYGATCLPEGLSVNESTGLISGTPALPGNLVSTISVYNAGMVGSAQLAINLLPPAPVITNGTLAPAGTQQPFYYQITANNLPENFNATGLPAGLSVNTVTGAIAGTPTATGSFSTIISAINGTGTGSANLVVVVAPYPDICAINTGGTAVSSGTGAASQFMADAYYTWGNTASTSSTISTSNVTNPAPMAVYQTYRYGHTLYNISGLVPAENYLVRLHEAESYCGGTGQRIFNVTINGTQVLTNYDVFAAAGGKNKAVCPQFTATSGSTGIISIEFIGSVQNPIICGIEIQALPLQVTSALIATGTAYSPFSYQIAASGTPTSYSVTGLPTGLSVNTTTGLISGTLPASGSYAMIVSAINASGTASATVALNAVPLPVYAVNSAGSTAGRFTADAYYSGGNTATYSATVNTNGVNNPAPQAVYDTERFGGMTYTFPNLTPGAFYLVRLHFAEMFFGGPGSRIFNVSINGTQALYEYDIFAAAGGSNRATCEEFSAPANASGQIVIQYTNVVNNAKSSGIEISRE